MTRQHVGLTGRLHFKKGTVEPKPPYGRTFLKEEVFDKRGPLFEVPTGLAVSRSTSPVLFLLTCFVCSSVPFKIFPI
ncbi:hypothetical protein HPY27_26035 [Brevibacillus sp. HB1.1]|nr:hypothetical protein [Brevibacillus sp. HB1.1]